VGDAAFAAAANVTPAVLDATVRVSTLLSNEFQVCREGSHRAVYAAGWAMQALFVVGFPAAAFAARAVAGRVGCLARAAPWAAGCGGARARFFAAAASDADMVPEHSWLRTANYALVAALVACTASATLATNAGTFAGVQAAAAAAAAALAAATARARPYRGKLAWRTHASVALLALTAVSAAINIALMYATREGGGPGSASSWALGVLLVALALAIFALLLAAWWRALVAEGGGGGVARGKQQRAGGAWAARLPDWLRELLSVGAPTAAAAAEIAAVTAAEEEAAGSAKVREGVVTASTEPPPSPPPAAAHSTVNPLFGAAAGSAGRGPLDALAVLREHPGHRGAFRWAAGNAEHEGTAAALQELREREALAGAAVARAAALGVRGGALVAQLREAGERARGEREAHEREHVLEAGSGEQYVVVEGACLFLDGRGGRPLAEGWRRMEDGQGDVWYVSTRGDSVWDPVYA
jgi:hypothetical protein